MCRLTIPPSSAPGQPCIPPTHTVIPPFLRCRRAHGLYEQVLSGAASVKPQSALQSRLNDAPAASAAGGNETRDEEGPSLPPKTYTFPCTLAESKA